MSWSNNEVSVLIAEYKKFPFLYSTKSAIYKNRNARNEALQKIELVLKEVRPSANVLEIKTKFNSIRNNFMVEHRKYVASKKSGVATHDIYRPSIWYYDKMMFLLEPAIGKDIWFDSINMKSVAENNGDQSRDSEVLMEDDVGFLETGEHQYSVSSSHSATAMPTCDTPRSRLSTPSPTTMTDKRSAKVDENFIAGAGQLLSSITSALAVETKAHEKDEIDLFFQLCSAKMRKITNEDIRETVEEKILALLRSGYKECKNSS